MQLLLIQKSETEILREELAKIREETANMRRGLFARHNELSKLFIEQQEELEHLKKKIG